MKLNKTQLEALTKDFRSLLFRAYPIAIAVACLIGPAFGQSCEGDLWRVADTKVISSDALVEEIGNARLVALGELHGVRGHVEAARCLLRQIEDTRKTSLVIEHVSSSDQARIDSFRSKHPETVSGLGKTLQWWMTGWQGGIIDC